MLDFVQDQSASITTITAGLPHVGFPVMPFTFKDLFDFKNDSEHLVIDFDASRVWDHSGLEALQNITERYSQNGKKLHLLNLSKECQALLGKAGNIVELSVIEGLEWHIAGDVLA